MNKLSLEPAKISKLASAETVQSILDTKGHDVVCVTPDATVFAAIAAMADGSIGALLVMDGRDVVGIVSERDYARKVILRGRPSKETLVREIMTPAPITVSPRHTVRACLRIMTDNRIRHLPVMENDDLQGVVSIGDLVKVIISAQAYTIDELHSYIGNDYPS